MPDIIEYKWKRTIHSKTFQVDRDKKKQVISLRPLHYEENGFYKEIDLIPKATAKGWEVKTPEYTCEIIKFPFEIKVNGNSYKNLDSPKTAKAVIEDGLSFPDAGIEIYFRPEGVEIFGEGTWKINGKVREESYMRVDFKRPLKAETFEEFLRVTNTKIHGEVVSWDFTKRPTRSRCPEDTDLLEVIFSHDQTWLHNNQ